MFRLRIMAIALLLWGAAHRLCPAEDLGEDYTRLGTLFDGSGGGASPAEPTVVASAGLSPAQPAPPADPSPSPLPRAGEGGQGPGEGGANPSSPGPDPAPPPPAGADKPPVPPLLDIPGSDWKAVGSVGDSVGDGNPSAREKQDFWDKLRDKSFWFNSLDTICKDAQLPLSYDLSVGEVFHARPEYKRFLHPGLDGGMLIVDRAKLDLSVSKGVPLASEGPLPVGIGAGVTLQGASWVIRPLAEPRACRDLLKLADLRTIKTVYPLKAGRFVAMQDGEIWQMPLVLTASFGPSVGIPADPIGITSLSVSFGYSRKGEANVSLRRLDRQTLRVRIRIDYARVIGPGIGANAQVPAAQFGRFQDMSQDFFSDLLGDGFLKIVGRNTVSNAISDAAVSQVRRWLNEYFTGRIHWLAQWVSEDHALIEFVLDPNDAEQMKGLEELLSGGRFQVLDTLTRRLRVAGEALAHRRPLTDLVVDWREKYEDALAGIAKGVKSFTGTDKVSRFASSFGFKLPILWDHARSSEKRRDFITIMDDSGGKFDSYKSRKESSNGFLHLPFLGDFAKFNESRSVMAFSYAEKDGLVVAPTVVFIHQEGYVNKPEDDARQLVRSADAVMRLAGTRGRGENPRAALPLQTVFPEQDARYRRGLGAFTLVLAPMAVAEIVSAPPEDVIRAYVRSLSEGAESRVLEWAFANRVVKNGKARLPDLSEAPDWPYGGFGRAPEMNTSDGFEAGVRSKFNFGLRLARQLQEIAALRPDGSQDVDAARRQSEALKNVIAGSAGHGVSYEDMMRILVQLADPRHLTAEMVVSAKPSTKGKNSIGGRYLYNRGLSEDPTLLRLYETAAKFHPPSTYSD